MTCMNISQPVLLHFVSKKAGDATYQVDVSRVKEVISKETLFNKRLATIVSSPWYTVSGLPRHSVTSVQDKVEEFLPPR